MIETVFRTIERTRLDLSSEKLAQANLATAFTSAGLSFVREVRLAPGDCIDFLIDEGGASIGVELKLKRAGKVATFRQITRYAKSERVKVLVLASNMAMGLPPTIEGKPVHLASLGRAWL